MRSAYLTRFALLGLLALAACSPNMPAGRATLGPYPALGGGFYTSPGGLTVAVDARNIGGRTGICGVWAESENQSVMTKNAARQVLASGAVTLEGEAVARGLGFLRKVVPARSYSGLEANCITTDRAWRPGDETRPLRVHLPRQIVRNEIDMDVGEGGGIVIWFRPSGPGAHPSDKTPW